MTKQFPVEFLTKLAFDHHLKVNIRPNGEVVGPDSETLRTLAGTTPQTSLAERLNPRQYGFSPKLTAIIGAIIGHDYGVRDTRGGHLTSISITSDGYVIARSTASDGGGAFIGDARDLT